MSVSFKELLENERKKIDQETLKKERYLSEIKKRQPALHEALEEVSRFFGKTKNLLQDITFDDYGPGNIAISLGETKNFSHFFINILLPEKVVLNIYHGKINFEYINEYNTITEMLLDLAGLIANGKLEDLK